MDEKVIEEIVNNCINKYNSLGFNGVYELRDQISKERDHEKIYISNLVIRLFDSHLKWKKSSERVYELDNAFRNNILRNLRNSITIDHSENEES